ncbi:MAG: site-2 protease family protein [Sulfurimicrobium sp.]|nr:site-2 protease family protein [Sulfurimicrobium sp.]MDP1704240.1 site-2 protease family protein [Sulfurimicrobium sp.]MDP2199199.1 site-2 protease family protein [Sulfurimicrobium sp.]MDP3687693.1 site-2 protease family protein [Sulfurimicrobium sp.]
MELTLVQQIAVYALPVIFAITLHEAAHGYAARHFGDTTAYMLGRISVNPLRHIDPIGTVLVPLATLALGGILFGWAKPVPVNFSHLRHPKRDMLWVAAAGPAANLVMALFWALVMKIGLSMPESSLALPMALMGKAGITINAVLMVLNLLPLLPLDGGRIAVSLLPPPLAYSYSRLEPYGMIILVVLLFSGALNVILWPMINTVMALVASLFGLH